MAHCSQTAQEFIRNAFAPQIAILCSEDADTLSLKNNLRFVELLQPFSSPKSEGKKVIYLFIVYKNKSLTILEY